MEAVVALTDALHRLGSAADLDDALDMLLVLLRQASPSTVGLEVLAVVGEQDVRLGRFVPGVRPSDVVTSLVVPLVPDPLGDGGTRVVFYAARAGALVDLAADLAYAQGPRAEGLELDGHRPASTASGAQGLGRVAVVERAVGVLIAGGLEPGRAYARLVADARAAATPLAEHAEAVVAEAVRAAEASGPTPDGAEA